MRIPIRLGVLTWIAAAAVAAPGPKDRPEKAPDITGEWTLTSLSVGGMPLALSDAGAVRIAVLVEFTADGRRVSRTRDGQVASEDYYSLGRDRDPPTYDGRKATDGPATSRGVYAIAGDILTICYVTDVAAERPTKVEAPAGSKITLAVFKRIKKD